MHDVNVAGFLANIVVILISAKAFGEIAERLGQPAVLGELVGGVVLGSGLISFFQPHDPSLSLMAELGVILLLFETGLESDLGALMGAGLTSLAVACAGVAVPFALGFGVMHGLGHALMPSVFVGAALTATSVGITARVLADMGRLDRPESHIVLGAAVIDDVLGIIILSAIQGMVYSGTFSWLATGRSALLALLFLVTALWLGQYAWRYLLKLVERMRVRGILIAATVSFAFSMALFAHALGTALIVGAFTAGLLLARTAEKAGIEQAVKPVTDIFAPIFFVMIGAKVDLGVYNPLVAGNWPMLGVSGLLIAVAILGKLAGGLAAWRGGLNRWAIGIGMVPRGEVGLIFAQIGLASGAIGEPLYAAIVAMVVVTTFISPPLLKVAFR